VPENIFEPGRRSGKYCHHRRNADTAALGLDPSLGILASK